MPKVKLKGLNIRKNSAGTWYVSLRSTGKLLAKAKTREEIDAAIAQGKEKGRVSLIYLESPANPTNALVDVEAVAAARDAAFGADERPPIAIDNTFLGPLWAKPLANGADLSVYSLTKYVGGHSDLVAGGLVGKQALIDQVRMIRNTIGTICDPNTAWMLLRSLETLELRMSRAGESAEKICAFLRDHPKVEKVGYLGFLEEGSRQSDIYKRHCTGAGGNDPFVGSGRSQGGAWNHRQSGANFDRRRKGGRPHRRLRPRPSLGLAPVDLLPAPFFR